MKGKEKNRRKEMKGKYNLLRVRTALWLERPGYLVYHHVAPSTVFGANRCRLE